MELFSYAVIGGLGSVAGAVSGVGLFRLLDFVLAKQFSGEIVAILRYTLSGAGLLWLLYFLPGGLWQFVQTGRAALLRRVSAEARRVGKSGVRTGRAPGWPVSLK